MVRGVAAAIAALCESEARLFVYMGVEIQATVFVDLSGLQQFAQQVDDQLNHRAEGPITKAFRQWGARYRGYIRERFDKYSKGGGDWPPLAESTKNQRRVGKKAGKKPARPKRSNYKTQKSYVKAKARYTEKLAKFKAKRKFAILRDTGTLFAALSPTFASIPGQFEEPISFGISVGYGGNSGHPKGKGATISQIANWHQIGAGHLPVRTIIVEPDQKTINAMSDDMERGIATLIKSSRVG